MFLPKIDDAPPPWIAVVPLGAVGRKEIEAVRRAIARTYRLEAVVEPKRSLQGKAYYPPRRRYRAEILLDGLAKAYPDATKVIGVTDVDISTTARGRKDWGIAGLAVLNGRPAVASGFRAKGQLADVAVHEVGHTLGLPHCPNAGCVMQDAKGKINNIGARFCPTCAARIVRWLR